MRITNVIGALFAFLLAIGIDYVLFAPIVNWITYRSEGTMQIILMFGIGMVFLFITIVVPLLMATADDKDIIQQ